jgi:xanthine dehydrogenase YagS FAD-binding subunit
LRHFNAMTISDALSLLREYREEARIIAGGVDQVSLMKNGVVTPKTLVNIKTIPRLSYIMEDDKGLMIGTLTTINEIEKSAIIRNKYPILAEAAHSVAAPQVRNMATIGGNLCQEVQCWYYRRPAITGISFLCFRKGSKRCYAVAGENTYHAILEGEKCYAVCPSDMAPALVALNSTLKIASSDGERMVPLDEFYTTLGNTLKPHEMITEIQIPTPMPGTKQKFLKFSLRKAIDFAISSVAAVITIKESGVVSNARIVLGGVAPTPYRALGAEETLRGEVVTESVADASASAAISEAKPLSMNAYKIPLTKSLAKRAIMGSV